MPDIHPDSALDISGAKILIVDDLPENLDVLYQQLESEGYQVLVATDGATAIEVAQREGPDLILLDVMMPEIDGFEVCKRMKANSRTRDIPIIFLTASNEPSSVVQGFRAGGIDYVMKPFQRDEVMMRIGTHLEHAAMRAALIQKNRALEAEIARREALDTRLSMISEKEDARWGIHGLVGESATMRKILDDIGTMQSADSVSVLITGESGTGKELVARAIHAGSARSDGPFVPVNCAAIPEQLAESLLFGHLKGAFTGAERNQPGYFELADGGTLFLDEVGAMPQAIQPILLRVLEDSLIRPIGESRDRAVDVRVLAATNEPESFRRDLYFRLARFQVQVPPLRDRREDIPLLARHFVQLFAEEVGRSSPDLSPAAVSRLAGYDFPGNVRELKNVMERAVIESRGASIQPEHLHGFQMISPTDAPSSADTPPTSDLLEGLPMDYESAERAIVERAVKACDGNMSAAARLLGIDRNKVYRILKR